MSVISTPAGASRLWPLWLLAALLLTGGTLLWLNWSQILLQSVLWQKDLHRQMTQLLQLVAEQPQQFYARIARATDNPYLDHRPTSKDHQMRLSPGRDQKSRAPSENDESHRGGGFP